MILKLSPLDSPDVGEPEKYPQHMPEVLRKRFRAEFFLHHISGVYTPLMRCKNSTTLNKFRWGKISMNFTHEFVLIQKNRVKKCQTFIENSR